MEQTNSLKAKFNVKNDNINNIDDDLIKKVSNALSVFESNFFGDVINNNDNCVMCVKKSSPTKELKWLEKDGEKIGPTIEYLFNDDNVCFKINKIE